MTSERSFHLAQQLLVPNLAKTIQRQTDAASFYSNPWTSSTNQGNEEVFADNKCEFVVYLQLEPLWTNDETHPWSSQNAWFVHQIEEELKYPTGSPTKVSHELAMRMVAMSPDCGFVIESKGPPDFTPREGLHLRGPKSEVYVMTVRYTELALLLILSSQLYLLVTQMKEASTPSTRSRISFYTFAVFALGDGCMWLSFVMMGTLSISLFTLNYFIAFLCMLSTVLFGTRFLMEIWRVQATERRRQARQSTANLEEDAETAQPEPPPTARIRTVGAAAGTAAPPQEGLPLPVTARRNTDTGATPMILPTDQDGAAEETENQDNDNTRVPRSREWGVMYIRFFLLTFGMFFLSFNASTWPAAIRAGYFNLLTFAYLSLWCPQIYRNVMRNCRKALRWDFVVGQSILRLLPIAYLWLYPDSVLGGKTSPTAFTIFAAWLWIQVLALASQEILGPRFFVKSEWAPEAYDYHPIIREDEEEASMPIGYSEAADPHSPTLTTTSRDAVTPGQPAESEKGKKVWDCAICMQHIEVPVVQAGGASDSAGVSAANILARRAYMVTPCRHIFHTSCLEGWMRYRLQCPICREYLPPL